MMISRLQIPLLSRRLLTGLTIAGSFTAGCVCFDHGHGLAMDLPGSIKPSRRVEFAQRSQAILAAGRSGNLILFGDLPGTGPVTYFSRSAISLEQHTFSDIGGDFDADIDPWGKRMVFASTRHQLRPDLYIKSVDGVSVTQLTADPGPDIQPAFSPDGRTVAFASRRSGNWDIWLVNVDGGPPAQVTSGPADEVHPSWSTDGSRLVYCSLPAKGGQWELWTTDATAGASKRFIGYGLFPEWSPVGDTIVYQRARERGSRWFSIWTLTLYDGEPRYPTEVSASATQAMILPTWSADGSQIAFASTSTVPPPPVDGVRLTENLVFDIWIMNADGRGRTRLTDGHGANHAPAFSPSGRVFFTSNRSGHDNIWSLPPTAPLSRDHMRNAVTHREDGVGETVTQVDPRNDL